MKTLFNNTLGGNETVTVSWESKTPLYQ